MCNNKIENLLKKIVLGGRHKLSKSYFTKLLQRVGKIDGKIIQSSYIKSNLTIFKRQRRH